MRKENYAILDNTGAYTTFTFRDRTITFLTSKRLDRYTEIKEWDAGYLVVMAMNKGEQPHEDYIDLVPILDNLRMDSESFLNPIKEVRIANG